MGALKWFAAIMLAALPAAAAAQSAGAWRSHIEAASRRFGVPEEWIRRVIQAESGGRTTLDGKPIRSRAGAAGLMQLMPSTWREMRIAHRLGDDPDDPRDNILAGTAYLRSLFDRFGYPGLFAAYNAGPARYADHLATGRPLPVETRLYIARITNGEPAAAARRTLQRARPQMLFAIDRGGQSPALAAGDERRAPVRSLFVKLRSAAHE